MFSLNYGTFYSYRQCQYKYLDEFSDQDIKEKLASDYIPQEVILSIAKGEQKRELSEEILKQNEIALNKVFDSIRNYIDKNPSLIDKYGNDLLLELTVDLEWFDFCRVNMVKSYAYKRRIFYAK